MISLNDELKTLKSEFSRLKEKVLSVEVQLQRLESRTSVHASSTAANGRHTSSSPPPECYASRIEDYQMFNVKLSSSTLQDLDKQTRNIIEELMWESTLSKAVLQVRETFKNGYSREMFLRYSFEMVLEKDEQYRKMIGTLFGHLLNQNVVNQTNVFNSLCSVLLVIENSSNYNTATWQNLTEILLPIITESHIKILHLQRKAQAILKAEYYCEFINHLMGALETYKGQKFKLNSFVSRITFSQHESVAIPRPVMNISDPKIVSPKGQVKFDAAAAVAAAAADAGETGTEFVYHQNSHDLDSLSKFKILSNDSAVLENCKLDLENLVHDYVADKNLDGAICTIKKLQSFHSVNSIIEELIDIAVQKEPQHRLAVGTLLAKLVCCGNNDVKQILISFCNHALSVQKLILNPHTRMTACTAFAEILSPLIASGKVRSNQLEMISSTLLPEELKTVFLWSLEKIMNNKDALSTSPSALRQSNLLVNKSLKRSCKNLMDNGEHCPQAINDGDAMRSKPKEVTFLTVNKTPIDGDFEILERKKQTQPLLECAERETYLQLKRKKLLKERIENTGDKNDIKTEDLLIDQNIKKIQDIDINGDISQVKAEVLTKPDADQAPIKQPENLPSSAIKEKMEEIIEQLMETGNMEECVSTIRDTFNECQTDLVFKAAFEYTKDKTTEYRTQCGSLIAEAFKHDPKRIGAQIMNTISLELGDFIDSPDLWKGMAEIICPPILSGLIRFTDLKLLPKYFKHTPYCASLLLALFKEILFKKGAGWLEDNWKKSRLDFTAFLPDDLVYPFLTDNALSFMLKDDELAHFKENTSDT